MASRISDDATSSVPQTALDPTSGFFNDQSFIF
jgi:hypothetical protein